MTVPKTHRRPSVSRHGTFFALVCVGALACEKEEPKPLTSEPKPEAESSAALVSPEIAEAVAQVAEAPSAAAENAPPENGMLPPDRAEREAPAAAPAKVVLGQAGSDPKVKLGGPELTDERIGQVTVSARTGPNMGMPSVAFKLEATGKAGEAGAHDVSFEVVEAALGPEQLGQVPPDIAKAIATMKGSKLGLRLQDGVLESPIAVELHKKTDPRADSLLTAAADAFTLIWANYPKEPVGQGGFWLVTAREKLGVADVVGYHLVKVEAIEGSRVTLSVATKRYLVGSEFQGLPALQFMGSAETDLVVMPGERLPIEGRTQQSLQAFVQREQGAPRPLMFELRALFAFPPKEAPTTSGSATPGPK